MNNKILVFAGKKQSGKSTAANFVVGYTLTQLARSGIPYLPHKFTIDKETGKLIVNATPWTIDNKISGEVILDLNDKTDDFIWWAYENMWPHVRIYAFADMLKAVAAKLFGIPDELVDGSDEDKRKLTHIKWKNLAFFLPPTTVARLKKSEKYDKKMSVREFLQYFGTNVCRKIDENCFVDSCYRRIEIDHPSLAIIHDCRFRNEVMISKKHGAKIVKLCRSPYKDMHDSEVDLDKMHNNNFDLIIPPDVTITEKNQLILDAMYKWGWFDKHIDLV